MLLSFRALRLSCALRLAAHSRARMATSGARAHGGGASAPPPPPPPPLPPPAAAAWTPWAPYVLAAAAASGAVMLHATLEARADARAVLALPLLESNAVVFLELTDDDAPLGRLLVQLRADACPLAAENFRRLCTHEAGFGFRRSPVHGLERGRRLLAGDFFGSGQGSHSALGGGATFADEAGGLALRHLGPGTVAMRNSGPDSNGSQFYVTLRRCPDLDGRSVVVGHVVDEASLQLLQFVEQHFAQGGEGRVKKGHDLRIGSCGVLDAAALARLKAGRLAAEASAS